jgi:twitching motility protein PilT
MQHFDGEIEKLVRAGTITVKTGMLYATNPDNLRLQLSDVGQFDAPQDGEITP